MKLMMKPLIYLDASFIVEAYETITKSQVPIKISKTEDVSTNLSAGFISGGASTKETKEFPLSIHRMYDKIRKQLLPFPSVDLVTTDYSQLPEYFWTTGVFGASGSETSRGNVVIHRESYFRLYSEIVVQKKSLVLVTNDVYFTCGYDQVQKHLTGSCQGFCIQVKGLFKFLSSDSMHSPICAPLIIEKLANV